MLFKCRADVGDGGPTLTPLDHTQPTRGIDPKLFYCWADVEDGGPTLEQHWANASCLLGIRSSVVYSTVRLV